MSNSIDTKLRQLPLDFTFSAHLGRDDFMVSLCNKMAFQSIERWPEWPSSGLFIYGPHGCGKTHLAHLFLEKVRASTSKPYLISIIDAHRVSMKNVRRLIDENTSIIIDNLTQNCNEEALFHLFNTYNQEGRYMLWTGELPPHRMYIGLPDLRSRLNMLPCVEIHEPDDVMLQTLIVKLFNDRQLLISPEILNYIVSNAERSFSYIQKLVEELDRLSMAYQCSVNYALVKQAMKILSTQAQDEPDLFGEWS